MPDKPVLEDVMCSFCGHAWCVELPKKDADDGDALKCPRCGKDGGKKVG
ncbi:MAG: hypothetical protein WC515_08645 [Candidatus Omnitrophota bacterium]